MGTKGRRRTTQTPHTSHVCDPAEGGEGAPSGTRKGGRTRPESRPRLRPSGRRRLQVGDVRTSPGGIVVGPDPAVGGKGLPGGRDTDLTNVVVTSEVCRRQKDPQTSKPRRPSLRAGLMVIFWDYPPYGRPPPFVHRGRPRRSGGGHRRPP